MKALASLMITAAALSANASTIYKCQFISERDGKKPFTMVGHIVDSETDSITYLTLQPAKVTGLNFDARILITHMNYNPMAIHPRGNTVNMVAHTVLAPEGTTTLEHVDENGLKYTLSCSKEN